MSKVPTPDEINAMPPGKFKTYENLIRRMAKRQGLRLEKSRRRDVHALDYGAYYLIRVETSGGWRGRELVSSEHGSSLDEIHRSLLGEDV